MKLDLIYFPPVFLKPTGLLKTFLTVPALISCRAQFERKTIQPHNNVIKESKMIPRKVKQLFQGDAGGIYQDLE